MVASKKLTRQGYGVFGEPPAFIGDTQEVVIQCCTGRDRAGHYLCGPLVLVQGPICNSLLSVLFLALNGKGGAKKKESRFQLTSPLISG